MKAYGAYISELRALATRPSEQVAIAGALAEHPSDALRRLVPRSERRRSGAYPTDLAVAAFAFAEACSGIGPESVVFDPACGTGNLLLLCARRLPRQPSLEATLEHWGTHLSGVDIHEEFVDAARTRLVILARQLHGSTRLTKSPKDYFPRIITGNGLAVSDAFRLATHIFMNPPFHYMPASTSTDWASGRVNAASEFVARAATEMNSGARLVAVLPEVLRSGSRYTKWRLLIERHMNVRRAEPFGLFSEWADVDVYVLDATKAALGPRLVTSTSSLVAQPRLGERFAVSVGPVVDYRSPHMGHWHPYLEARGLPPWKTITPGTPHRRFAGRTIKPPFVVVRRTSRPGDLFRAVGSIVNGDREVAVENHLMVLQPRTGGLVACEDLLQYLRTPLATEYLNQKIRCRHLTVSSLAEMPLSLP